MPTHEAWRKRSIRSWSAHERLENGKLWASAMSRLYYAVYQRMVSKLIKVGLQDDFEGPDGVQWSHTLVMGERGKEALSLQVRSSVLRTLKKARHSADYVHEPDFDEYMYSDAKASVRKLILMLDMESTRI